MFASVYAILNKERVTVGCLATQALSCYFKCLLAVKKKKLKSALFFFSNREFFFCGEDQYTPPKREMKKRALRSSVNGMYFARVKEDAST